MAEFTGQLKIQVIGQTVFVWAICLVLAAMVLDGGFILGYYLIASFLFWSGSLIYFHGRRGCWPSDLWAFRLGPLVLLVLGFVGGTLVEIFKT